MKIFSDNCRKGMRLYKGEYSLLLNFLWWGLAPIGAILIVGGIVCNTYITVIIGLVFILVGGFIYAIFAAKNEENRWPWEKKENIKG